jgi:hypothetical protein
MNAAILVVSLAFAGPAPVPTAMPFDPELLTPVADQQPPPPVKRQRYLTKHGRYYVIEEYPIACEAVRFPQSPLCKGRPFQPSWYGIDW